MLWRPQKESRDGNGEAKGIGTAFAPGGFNVANQSNDVIEDKPSKGHTGSAKGDSSPNKDIPEVAEEPSEGAQASPETIEKQTKNEEASNRQVSAENAPGEATSRTNQIKNEDAIGTVVEVSKNTIDMELVLIIAQIILAVVVAGFATAMVVKKNRES